MVNYKRSGVLTMNKKGFTLVELMIVVSICVVIGMLVFGTKNGHNNKDNSTTEEVISPVGKALQGDHPLSMIKKNDSYFIVSAGDTDVMVMFCWKMNNGTYALSQLPSSKIRFIFDEYKRIPSIKFRWGTFYSDTSPSSMMVNSVLYAVVTCKKEDCFLGKEKDAKPLMIKDIQTDGIIVQEDSPLTKEVKALDQNKSKWENIWEKEL